MSPPEVCKGLQMPSKDLPSAKCWMREVSAHPPPAAVTLRWRVRPLRRCSDQEQSQSQRQSVFAALPLRVPLPTLLHCRPPPRPLRCRLQRRAKMGRRASVRHRPYCSVPTFRTPAPLSQQTYGSYRLYRQRRSDRLCAAAALARCVLPAHADRAHADHDS